MSSSVGYSAGSASLSPTEIAGAGATSGFITRMVTQPLDVLKIRFQLQVESTRRGAGGQYHGLLQGGWRVVREEGVKALWRGHVAAQALTVLYGAGQFWCYNLATRTCHERNKLLEKRHGMKEQHNSRNNHHRKSFELDSGIEEPVGHRSVTPQETPHQTQALSGSFSNSDSGLRGLSSQCAQSIIGDSSNSARTSVTSTRIEVNISDKSRLSPKDAFESSSSHVNYLIKPNLSDDSTYSKCDTSRTKQSSGILVPDNDSNENTSSQIRDLDTNIHVPNVQIDCATLSVLNSSIHTTVSRTNATNNNHILNTKVISKTQNISSSVSVASDDIGSATSKSSPPLDGELSNSSAVTVSQMSFCGGVAGLCGTLVSMPCDVARTRIVAQSTKKYRGLLDVWGQMRRQEGVTSLWRGLLPTIASSAPYAAVQFPVYSTIMTVTEGWGRTAEGNGLMWRSPLAGCAAGLVAKLAVYPLDLLKKRSQMRGAEHLRQHFGKVVTYRNSLDIVRRVTLEEGALAWFKGLSPALVKSAFVSALAFSTFETCCLLLRTVHGSGLAAGEEDLDGDAPR